MNTLLSVVIRFSLIGCLWLSIVSFSWAQGVLQGKVTDNENKPIVGATILLQNTSFSTFSDNNGTFIKIFIGLFSPTWLW
jgi:hypothetical protein